MVRLKFGVVALERHFQKVWKLHAPPPPLRCDPVLKSWAEYDIIWSGESILWLYTSLSRLFCWAYKISEARCGLLACAHTSALEMREENEALMPMARFKNLKYCPSIVFKFFSVRVRTSRPYSKQRTNVA